jgi:protein-S-isoprenylcysteine O-methyltransferase Ste14
MKPWDSVWAAAYLLGGLLLFLGIGRRRVNVEAAGCILFVTGVVIEALAFLSLLGWTKTTSWLTVALLLVFGAAAAARLWQIVTGRHHVLVKFGERADDAG